MEESEELEVFANEVTAKLLRAGTDEGLALLLDGPWGSGKTWLWENVLRDRVLAGGRTIAYASLMGVEDREQLARRLAIYAFQTDSGVSFGQRVAKTLTRVRVVTTRVVGKELGLELTRSAFESMDYMAEGTVICLDDVERAHPSFTIQEILGLVDYLVLTRKCTVLVLCNTEGLRPEVTDAWAALVERVFFWRVKMSAFPTAVKSVIERLADELSVLEVAELTRIFDTIGGDNLRRLKRVAELAHAIKERFGKELPTQMISCLYMVQSDFDKGQLRTLEEYQRDVLATFRPPDIEVAKTARQNEIRRRLGFYGNMSSYRFFPEVAQLVVDGHGLEPLERYLGDRPMRRIELLVNQVQNNRWRFMSDIALNEWCIAAIGHMKTPALENMRWDELVSLAQQVAVIDSLLQTTYLPDAEYEVRDALDHFVDDRDDFFPDTDAERQRGALPAVIVEWSNICREKRHLKKRHEVGLKCLEMLRAGQEFEFDVLRHEQLFDEWLAINYQEILPYFAQNRSTVFALLWRLVSNQARPGSLQPIEQAILNVASDVAGQALLSSLFQSPLPYDDDALRDGIAIASTDDFAPTSSSDET